MHAVDFLRESPASCAPVYALYGDEPFFKRHVLAVLRAQVLGADDGELSRIVFDGRSVELAPVFDELSTLALFGDRRLIHVQEADDFVSRYREQLEAYVAKPSSHAVLVLDVASWPANTRLAKAVQQQGLPVECKAPPAGQLLPWLVSWAKSRHQAKLQKQAAELLVETLGPEVGLLDQELAKLAAGVGPQGEILAQHVRDQVGGWRTRTAWELLDEAAAGNAARALEHLDCLLASGEAPVALLAQVSWTLRRFAAATRLLAQAEAAGRTLPPLKSALAEVGIKGFALGKAEAQLRQVGRQRAAQLWNWLLQADAALKGGSSAPPRARLVLESLIARLSAPAAPRR